MNNMQIIEKSHIFMTRCHKNLTHHSISDNTLSLMLCIKHL